MGSYQIKKSSTAYPLVFLMIDSSDHLTGKTGLTVTVTISKNGGAFGSPSGAVSEIGNGWYKVAGNATDSGSLGPLLLHATATGADPTDELYEVVAHDVQDAVNLGLSGFGKVWDEILTGATHNIQNSSGKILRTITGGNTGAIYSGTLPAQTSMTSTQVKLDTGASASSNTYIYDVISFLTGTASGQSRFITGYVGSTRVATVDSAWDLQPASGDTYEITPTARAQVIGVPDVRIIDATAGGAALVADGLLGRNLAGGSDGGRTVSSALAFLRNKWTISGGTLTVYAVDDSTTLWTSAITTAAGNPINSSDPS